MHLSALRSSLSSKVRKISFSYCSAPLNHYQEQDDRCRLKDQELKENKEPLIGSRARIHKLIGSQSDPLLAKEIFDLACRQPNFQHSYATYHSLILKLGRSHHFSLMHGVLSSLKSHNYSISPSLFTQIIEIYGDAKLPEKVLKTFYTILEFNIKPLTKHLNCILEILVANRNFLQPAFDLFRSAHKYGVSPNTKSYNIMMRAFCLNDDLSIAYTLFNQMFKRDVLPDVESYRILMQGLCRKSQVNKAVDLLEDMLNKGFVPDTLSYTTLLNSLCRKKKLKEAYKLLCRMKVKGCNPDILHYNTVISGYCKVGRAADACKVLDDMPSNGCLPNLLSYQSIVGGLCNQGMYTEAKSYFKVMISKGFCPHFSVVHLLVKGFCKIGKTEDACEVVFELLRHGNSPHADTWAEILPSICEADNTTGDVLQQVIKVEIKSNTRIVDVGAGLEDYLIKKIKTRSRTS
ncbi:UNVERIFIED_CONTAM: Pentatricopeptide repeat-containing protein, mitochondrial [Sesamum calycinum]|uniref:Pentatricopeptide repeat-containing protein, mitochondrial n=1 Tax=Sesamum calycinum TaxID=2727403 RepID=A0AAW2S9I4_9LAMI